MSTHAFNIRLRLIVSALCAVAAMVLYVPAEAKAVAFHDFIRSFVHPWGNLVVTLLILGSCVGAIIAAVPVIRMGSFWLRTSATAVAACPAVILVRFLVWTGHQWMAQ
jgi:hypothetical protein